MSAGHTCPFCGKIFWSQPKFDDHLFGHGTSRAELEAAEKGPRQYTNLPVPPWLQSQVDQLQARVRSQFPPGIPLSVVFGNAIVTMPLTEPAEGSSKKQMQRWEFTCDNCGRYCPDPIPFHTGTLAQQWDGVQVLIFYGACSRCLPEPAEDQ